MSEGTGQEREQEQTAEEAPAVAAVTPPELAAVRELALRAHPDVVPELVGGGSVAELMASLEPARAAYRRIAEAARNAGAARPPVVPAGDAPRVAIDPELLPAAEKIRRGLAERQRRAGG